MTGAADARGDIGRLGRRRHWPAVLLLGGLGALGWAALRPPAARGAGPAIAALDPERLACLEQTAWEAYYERQWPRLGWLLLQISRTQFNLSWAQALYGALLATRAQVAFARQGDAAAAQEAMRRYYALIRQPAGGRYDPDRAAAAEINWWVVHRRRHQYPDYGELDRAMANLYAELYQVPAEAMAMAARHRVAAVEVSDRWLDEGQPPGSPLLDQVRAELEAGYRALKAVGSGQWAVGSGQ